MNRIRKLRIDKSLTQDELGKILNVQKAAVSKYELGRAMPSPDILLKLAKYFNVSTDYLLGNDISDNSHLKKDTADLAKFLDKTEIMFDGDTYHLDNDGRQKLRNALEFVFWDAKKQNKRKKD
jgi:transcriptional regulator with XRE-family HTH domain